MDNNIRKPKVITLAENAAAAAPGVAMPRAKAEDKRGGYYDNQPPPRSRRAKTVPPKEESADGLQMPRAKTEPGRGWDWVRRAWDRTADQQGAVSPGNRPARRAQVATTPFPIRAMFFLAFAATALWSGWLTQAATGYAGFFGIAISVFFFFGQFVAWYLEPRGAYLILGALWLFSITFNLAGFRVTGGFTPANYSLSGLDDLHYLIPKRGQELRWFLDVILAIALDVAQEPFLIFAISGRLRKG